VYLSLKTMMTIAIRYFCIIIFLSKSLRIALSVSLAHGLKYASLIHLSRKYRLDSILKHKVHTNDVERDAKDESRTTC
jgi:hypothetical protein